MEGESVYYHYWHRTHDAFVDDEYGSDGSAMGSGDWGISAAAWNRDSKPERR